MNDQWGDVFVRFLILSGFGILFIMTLLMIIDSYIAEKPRKHSSRFKTAAMALFGLWFLNNIALLVFGILFAWFSLEKWEIWASYAIALLIGLVIWLLTREVTPKSDRNLLPLGILYFAMIVISLATVIGLISGHLGRIAN